MEGLDNQAGASNSTAHRRQSGRNNRRRPAPDQQEEHIPIGRVFPEDHEDQHQEPEAEEENEQLEQQPPNDPADPARNVAMDLKLRMPEYKGKKGRDPQVHIQAFESWAVLRGLPRRDWRVCFPQTLRSAAQKWYFNYPPENLTTYKQTSKALVQRFKEEKSDEELLSQLGKIKQKKASVRQFVEEIKDLARQLSSPPANKSLRAWFLNGTTLKSLAKSEITNPTRSFEELVERAVKMERKGTKRQRESSSDSSSSEGGSSSEDSSSKTKVQQELKRLRRTVEELSGVRTKMPSKAEKWCLHCRDDSHATSECVKCDYCEKRGHEWEACPVRLAVPAVRLAAPVAQEATVQPTGPPAYYRPTYNRPPPRKFNCWSCGEEGHMARDCPKTVDKTKNPEVHMALPEVAAVTRSKKMSSPKNQKTAPIKKWVELKEKAVQITKQLQKHKPTISMQLIDPPLPQNQRWVRKLQQPQQPAPETLLTETARECHDLLSTPKSSTDAFWEGVTERVTKLSVELQKLAQAIPMAEKLWEGPKTIFEVNRTEIRDDQAPVIRVECKIRGRWKPVDKATLDGGAGVNIMSERVRKQLGLQCKPAPFKLRMANQTLSEPIGLVEDVPIRVAGIKFRVSFLILDVGDSYDALLGRPWLRAAKAVHNWSTDELTLINGETKVTIPTMQEEIPKACRPGDIYVAEADELWKKLEGSSIVPLTTLDLNW